MDEQLTVLIIDDNPDDLEFFQHLLQRSARNYNILTASNPSDGIEIIARSKPDCVFMDYKMPSQSGIDVLEQLSKKDKHGPAIIIMTGLPHQKIQADAARLGAFDYIVKDSNLTTQVLDSLIQKCVNSAREMMRRMA